MTTKAVRANEAIHVVFYLNSGMVAKLLVGKRVKLQDYADWQVLKKTDQLEIGYDYEEGVQIRFACGIQVAAALEAIKSVTDTLLLQQRKDICFSLCEPCTLGDLGGGYRPSSNKRSAEVFKHPGLVKKSKWSYTLA